MCRGTSHKLISFDAVGAVISVFEHDTLEDAEDVVENVESDLKNV
jgi:hypothetical protein